MAKKRVDTGYKFSQWTTEKNSVDDSFPEVKPCPFCGSKVEYKEKEYECYDGNQFENTFAIIECRKCGVEMRKYPFGYGITSEEKRKIIEKWNKRIQ